MNDLLYAFTEWLRTTPLVELSIWISELPLSLAIGSNFWVIPILQTLHILSIAAAFGSVLMINFRILGLAGHERTMVQTVRRYQPWIWWALGLLIATGFFMIIGEPVRELINPIFWIKMVLVVAVILVSAAFQSSVRRGAANGQRSDAAPAAARAGAILVILLWCAVMIAGRWIAYAPV